MNNRRKESIDRFLCTVAFLERLQSHYEALPASHIRRLGQLYALSTTPNAEIRARFYELALLDATPESSKDFAGEALLWVSGEDGTGVIKGRMKFCRPVFRAAGKVDKDRTVMIWGKCRPAFHPIAQRLVDKVSSLRNLRFIAARC